MSWSPRIFQNLSLQTCWDGITTMTPFCPARSSHRRFAQWNNVWLSPRCSWKVEIHWLQQTRSEWLWICVGDVQFEMNLSQPIFVSAYYLHVLSTQFIMITTIIHYCIVQYFLLQYGYGCFFFSKRILLNRCGLWIERCHTVAYICKKKLVWMFCAEQEQDSRTLLFHHMFDSICHLSISVLVHLVIGMSEAHGFAMQQMISKLLLGTECPVISFCVQICGAVLIHLKNLLILPSQLEHGSQFMAFFRRLVFLC